MPPTTRDDRDEIALRLLGSRQRFPAYFALYETLTSRANARVIQIDNATAEKIPEALYHQGVLFATEILKAHGAEKTLAEVLAELDHQNSIKPTVLDVQNTVNVAVQAMLMIDCAASDWHSGTFMLGGYKPTSWLSSERLVEFLGRSFPRTLDDDEDGMRAPLQNASRLKAWKLKTRLGITFRGTDNLAEHLLFDPRHNVLYLFHHAAYLKAQLARHAQTLPLDCDFEESLKCGTLPPQLLVETLHSLQSIIFPATDAKSAALLSQLVRKRGFDADCAQYDGYKRFQDPPDGFLYVYWGDRIARLYDLMGQRVPRSRFERWIQWQTTDSNALIVALLALLITIFLGALTLALAALQTWIAWQAWKYPVPDTCVCRQG